MPDATKIISNPSKVDAVRFDPEQAYYLKDGLVEYKGVQYRMNLFRNGKPINPGKLKNRQLRNIFNASVSILSKKKVSLHKDTELHGTIISHKRIFRYDPGNRAYTKGVKVRWVDRKVNQALHQIDNTVSRALEKIQKENDFYTDIAAMRWVKHPLDRKEKKKKNGEDDKVENVDEEMQFYSDLDSLDSAEDDGLDEEEHLDSEE